ncbi:hypothetical protein OENI_90017 [Oenococcus oeni]|nr:hypothetical protein OENI_90017 [Oenococcus oeni]
MHLGLSEPRLNILNNCRLIPMIFFGPLLQRTIVCVNRRVRGPINNETFNQTLLSIAQGMDLDNSDNCHYFWFEQYGFK